MTATFAYMPRQTEDPDADKSKVNISGRVDPALKEPLDGFGKRLRELGVHRHGKGGESNALEALLEMATHLGWFDEPEMFAAELMQRRAAAMSARLKPKK